MSLFSIQGGEIDTLPPGRLTKKQLAGTAPLSYFAYRPTKLREDQPPLVFVHGYSRRAEEHARALLPLCEALGCTLLAPLFAKSDHPRYQRLGRGRCGQRADRILNACIENLFGHDPGQIHLAGFSGGAQFAHRYTMAHPDRVAHLVAIAAGWYTLPDPSQRYPLGLHTYKMLRGISLNPEQFLRVPMTVMVGDRDTGKQNLRRSPELDAQQGATRVERARNWVAYMRVAARIHQLQSVVRYIEVPGIGHDFEEFLERGHLVELMRESLSSRTRSRPGSAPFLLMPAAEIRAITSGVQHDSA
ncbi:MAG: alpha/beta hydrolase [Chromatocurvus sp.]